MRKQVIAAALLASIATPAFAVDFEGPRVEVRAGLDDIKVSVEDQGSENKSGIAYGFGVGYDIAVGSKTTFGLEANLDLAETKTCSEVLGLDEACIKAGRDISVVARAGYKVSENALFYILAGYTNARIKFTYEDFENIIDDFSVGDNGDGVRLGAGLEYAFTENVYIKAEYRYSNYEGGFSRNQGLFSAGYRF